ncbi:MAG: class I SAM-dependent methyltransferase [Acidimicrobiia bacterium]
MEVEEYARIAAVEDDHWWYRTTRGIVADLLATHVDSAGGDTLRILDAGCGPGGNGAWLAAHGTVIGVDRSPDALRFVHERRPALRPVRADVAALPLGDATIDVAIAITVLYAVPDDRAAIAELTRVLAPGGALVVVEPAFPSLRRAHDATVHGQRRYRRRPLSDLLTAAGLHVLRATYAYSFLTPAAAALAAADRVRSGHSAATASDVERRTLDRVFAPLAAAERRLLTHVDVPVGTSVAVLATR